MTLPAVSFVACLSIAASSAFVAEPSPTAGAVAAERGDVAVRRVFEGCVVEPEGAPAIGALVVSSAGGEAVADHGGRYRLEVAVPRDARSVELFAVSAVGDDRTTRARVALADRPRVSTVATLRLAQKPRCEPRWLPTFGAQPGMDAAVATMVRFDDGSGPALYAGGNFETAGGVVANHVARWDGKRWSKLQGGTNGSVRALVVFDDGGGPALYAGGDFTNAGGVEASHIARWNGASWTTLGAGTNHNVRALAVFDDGGGPALYAGGLFTSAGGGAASRVAKWNGSSWSPVGSGTSGPVFALTVFDDGSGPALHAGGSFANAGGGAASRVAKWDGSSWSALGSGANSTVLALTAYDDGSGAALHAGGSFTTAGGVAANRVAKWDGSAWSALGSGVDEPGGFQIFVAALTVFEGGEEPALWVGGAFSMAGGASAAHLASWDGTSWSTPSGGTTNNVQALYAPPGENELWVGGTFDTAGSVAANRVAKWDGANWEATGKGLDGRVYALAGFDDGNASALFVGGFFDTAGGAGVPNLARWNGAAWSGVGSGTSSSVLSLHASDLGTGSVLFAGGNFATAGGVTVNRVAAWNGSIWASLAGGVSGGGGVEALATFDDGGGPALYAGGDFQTIGGVSASFVARWNGAAWSALGSGLTSNPVRALAVFDDGSGPALFAAGGFWGIMKWDGATWAPLIPVSPGANNQVTSLALFDDGNGLALYAGGWFTSMDGVAADHVARWDGASWSPVGGLSDGTNGFVQALAVFDDGHGAALYVGGDFTVAGETAASRIARWDGSEWSPLGAGVDDTVFALTAFDDGNGPALYLGGDFGAVASGDSHVAKWGCRNARPTPGKLLQKQL